MDPIAQVRKLRETLPAEAAHDDNLREALMVEARKLFLALEQPQHVVARIGFQQIEAVACSIAIKSGIFRALSQRSPQTMAEIAKSTGMDPLLLGRVLRCLSSYGAVAQDDPTTFSANMVSDTLARPISEAGIEWDLEFLSRGWSRIPAQLQEEGWKSFTRATDTPVTKAWNMPPGSNMFETVNASPHHAAFMTYLTAFDEGHKPWIEFYPVKERIAANLDPSAPTFVDVGGGLGHQAAKFKSACQLPGRHIVQDYPHVFPPESDRVPGIDYMVHDFFAEQPAEARGAAVYYMRYVPHDWSQETCISLCTQLRNAMKPGYSKVIVNEWIIPDVEPSPYMTSMDLTMMAATGGMERTEGLHRQYLERAGLTVTGVFKAPDNVSEGVIEAMLM